jgi:hypothetical protein
VRSAHDRAHARQAADKAEEEEVQFMVNRRLISESYGETTHSSSSSPSPHVAADAAARSHTRTTSRATSSLTHSPNSLSSSFSSSLTLSSSFDLCSLSPAERARIRAARHAQEDAEIAARIAQRESDAILVLSHKLKKIAQYYVRAHNTHVPA